MLRNPQASGSSSSSFIGHTDLHDDNDDDDQFRDIHALTPQAAALPVPPSRQRSTWDASSVRSSIASDVTNSTENFTTMSREFNALVLAGSSFDHHEQLEHNNNNNSSHNLDRIGEDEEGGIQESNPLAIVADVNPLPSPTRQPSSSSSLGHHLMTGSSITTGRNSHDESIIRRREDEEVGVERVKKEEVEAKISAWQTAKISKINNRFKREDAIISGWENEQLHKASSTMKKVERKLEEKRAKAREKMENEIAKAHRKAEERRASAEGKRGTKVARVLEVANLMRALGRPPAKRSFF